MVKIKYSKPISEIKKGDTVKIDGKSYEVDAQYVLINHGNMKEMAIELFDPKAREEEGDYQLRYFSDQFENSIRFFILDDIIYNQIDIEKVEW